MEPSNQASSRSTPPAATCPPRTSGRAYLLVAFAVLCVSLMMYNALGPLSNLVHSKADYLLSGSFNSTSLYLFAFDRSTSTLSLLLNIPALGPHQYLYYDRLYRRVYTTSWALPPQLSTWSVDTACRKIQLLNRVPITSTSSYITLHLDTIYSVGGPSGELHSLNLIDRRLQHKLQEVLYCSEVDLPKEDKTRKALRYGSHAIEISSRDQAFVPHLGHNSIYMYSVDRSTKLLKLISETKSPRPHDGPRHCVVSEDGDWLYTITEHTQFVDLYQTSAVALEHRTSAYILPSETDLTLSSKASDYRGDTIRILPTKLKRLLKSSVENLAATQFVFATTRGSEIGISGILAILKHDTEAETLEVIKRWPTPTSGGKANAIEFRSNSGDDGDDRILIVLTDDEVGWVMVLEWDLKAEDQIKLISKALIDQIGVGASHAVWL